MTELYSHTQYESTLHQVRNSNKNIVAEMKSYNMTKICLEKNQI